jgi:hypothetical protein
MRDPTLSKLYSVRFAAHEKERKDRVRRVLCRHFLQRYIEPECTVLDIGAGYCEFINHIVRLRSGLRTIRLFTCSEPEVSTALPRSSRSEGRRFKCPQRPGLYWPTRSSSRPRSCGLSAPVSGRIECNFRCASAPERKLGTESFSRMPARTSR